MESNFSNISDIVKYVKDKLNNYEVGLILIKSVLGEPPRKDKSPKKYWRIRAFDLIDKFNHILREIEKKEKSYILRKLEKEIEKSWNQQKNFAGLGKRNLRTIIFNKANSFNKGYISKIGKKIFEVLEICREMHYSDPSDEYYELMDLIEKS